MQTIIHTWSAPGSFQTLASLPRQELTHDWYGEDVDPAFEFAFASDGEYLWFLASRQASATIHPEGQPGAFQPELWKYDVAEFFLASTETGAYWEFNLSFNGAWWACGFKAAREADPALALPSGIETEGILTGILTGTAWQCMAKIPLKALTGIDLLYSKLAVTSILNTPDQIFLTTADNLGGNPDFHRPDDWAMPILTPQS